MTIIKLKVVDENIGFTSSPPIYSGDVNTISTLFDFDDNWKGFAKTAVFYREIETPYQVVLVNDECLVPHEVMLTHGRIYMGVFGVKDDKVKTSEVVYYDIGTGVMTYGSIPEPSDTIWQQILNELTDIRELSATIKQEQVDFIDKTNKAEAERATNENERKKAENERNTAEEERKRSEAERKKSESQRLQKETERMSAETSRIAEEKKRATQENGRVSAETQRVSEWSAIKEQLENILDKGVIDDNSTSALSTWSSNKINTELANKQNAIISGISTPNNADGKPEGTIYIQIVE